MRKESDKYANLEISKLAKKCGFNLKCEFKHTPNAQRDFDYEIYKGETHTLHCDQSHGMYDRLRRDWNSEKVHNGKSWESIDVKYGEVFSSPTLEDLKNWIFETHNLFIEVSINTYTSPNNFCSVVKLFEYGYIRKSYYPYSTDSNKHTSNPISSLENGIITALEIIIESFKKQNHE